MSKHNVATPTLNYNLLLQLENNSVSLWKNEIQVCVNCKDNNGSH